MTATPRNTACGYNSGCTLSVSKTRSVNLQSSSPKPCFSGPVSFANSSVSFGSSPQTHRESRGGHNPRVLMPSMEECTPWRLSVAVDHLRHDPSSQL
eukprot:4829600-Amphidinium_carterae.1